MEVRFPISDIIAELYTARAMCNSVSSILNQSWCDVLGVGGHSIVIAARGGCRVSKRRMEGEG